MILWLLLLVTPALAHEKEYGCHGGFAHFRIGSGNCHPDSESGNTYTETEGSGSPNWGDGSPHCWACQPGRFQGSETSCDGCCSWCGTCCDQCPKGWYNDKVQAWYCKECEPGKYQDMEMRQGNYGNDQPTSCKTCPDGYVTSCQFTNPSSPYAPDQLCSSTRYRFKSCQICPAGFYEDRRYDVEGNCHQCKMRNTYMVAASKERGLEGYNNCLQCPYGYYSLSLTWCYPCGTSMAYNYLKAAYAAEGLL